MGNLVNTLKKFFTNKNTVTIIGVIGGVIVLWFFYNYRLNQAINPQKVPIAKREILATEEIKREDIDTVEVNSDLLKKSSIITNINQLVGYYVNVGTSIPEGGLFYTSQVVDFDELPNAITDNIPDGYAMFQLSVNNSTTFGNSIYPGDYIDIYLRTEDEQDRTIYGCLVESIQVLAVRDSSGKDVFDGTGSRSPAVLLFAAEDPKNSDSESMYKLLMAASNYRDFELIPVPRNKLYTEKPSETKMSNDYIVQLVQSRMYMN